MKKLITKKLKQLFKQAGYDLYKIIYGRIKEVVYSEDETHVKKQKIQLTNRLPYRVYTILKARLYTDTINNLAIIHDDKLLEGPSFQYKNVKNSNIQENFVLKNGTPKIKKKLNGTIFVLLTGGAGNDNYWHWLFDVLPRLELLNKQINIKEIDYFLFPDIHQKFQIETLDALNIPKHKRLSSKKYRHFEADKIITVDHPYVLKNDPSNEIQNMPEWIIEWLRDTFLKNMKFDQNNLKEKIYIDRSDSKSNLNHTRKITNEDLVKKLLIKNGFSIIQLSNLSFLEQVSLFRNASKIVGLHGGGFANIIFCNPKTLVLEIKSSTAGAVIKNLAKKNNLNYRDISITPHEHAYNNQQGFVNVPLDVLEKKINY